ncbi:MAG: peptide-methionine (R)-S-oxide reductase MsrB [Pseudomonadota bacterium]
MTERKADAGPGGAGRRDAGKVVKTDSEWRGELSDEQYRVCRLCGTEPPFTGRFWSTKTHGLYRCVCCRAPLFRSETKFDSGTGWPSYWQPVSVEAIREVPDYSHGMTRVEIRCARCDSHLGHVFEDGPPPTGLRYCVNSASLDLEPDPDAS